MSSHPAPRFVALEGDKSLPLRRNLDSGSVAFRLDECDEEAPASLDSREHTYILWGNPHGDVSRLGLPDGALELNYPIADLDGDTVLFKDGGHEIHRLAAEERRDKRQ